jgi:hypothetical protein
MNHPWTDKLSDYIDGELDAHEQAATEQHLATCESCRETVAQLRRVVERASALEPRMPERDLWSGIAERINAEGVRDVPRVIPMRTSWHGARFSLSAPQLVAAGMLIAVLSSVGVWFALRGPMSSGGSATLPQSIAGTESSGIDALPVSGYEPLIAELEQTLEGHRSRLDPATIDILEQNLAIIDVAIQESREALAADPASSYLHRHLDRQMQQKVDLLEQAAQYAYASN